jgi:hypothetical protein
LSTSLHRRSKESGPVKKYEEETGTNALEEEQKKTRPRRIIVKRCEIDKKTMIALKIQKSIKQSENKKEIVHKVIGRLKEAMASKYRLERML